MVDSHNKIQVHKINFSIIPGKVPEQAIKVKPTIKHTVSFVNTCYRITLNGSRTILMAISTYITYKARYQANRLTFSHLTFFQ